MELKNVFKIHAPKEARTKECVLVLWDKANEGRDIDIRNVDLQNISIRGGEGYFIKNSDELTMIKLES